MIDTIVLAIYGTLCALWLLLSTLTIFLMIKYNGISITVWIIIILYCVITLPLLLSGTSAVLQNDIDYNVLIPRILIQ